MSLAREWVENSLNIHGAAGGEWLVECPWCSRPKMYVNPDKGFVCFRCREKGGIPRLVAKVEGIDTESAKELLKSKGVIDEADLREQLRALDTRRSTRRREPAVHPLPDEFIPCFNGKEWRVPGYLDERDFSNEMIIRHGLGYAEEGRYRDRVIVPVIHGETRTFLARLMGPSKWFRWTTKEGEVVEPPRYLTPKDAGLSDIIYGASWIKPGQHLIGVEGAFDAMRLTDLGFHAIAFFGKRITPRQAAEVKKLKPASLTILFDDDAATYAFLDSLRLTHTLPEVYVGRLPSGFDPDSLGRARGREGIEDVLKRRRASGDPLDALSAALEQLRI